MTVNSENPTKPRLESEVISQADHRTRRVYTPPTLDWFGDIRDITLAGSPREENESGVGFGKKNVA